MAIWTTIEAKDLGVYLRANPEFYLPKFLENAKSLNSIPTLALQDLSKIVITKGETPLWRGDAYIQEGMPFLRSENLIPAGLDLERLVFVSDDVHKRMKRSKIYPNDFLLAIVGATIGQTGLATNEYREYNCNQAIAIVRPENAQIADYLSVVALTKFVQLQIERLKGGGSRDNLDLHEVRILRIPQPEKNLLNLCDKTVERVRQLREQSQRLYLNAQNILLEELGIKDLGLSHQLAYTAELKDVINFDRIDAEYYQPKYKKLLEVVGKRFEIKDLKEAFNFRRGIFISTDYYTEEKTPLPYIRIKELAEKGGISKSEIIFLSEKYLGNDADKLRENDLVIAIIGDTIGKTNKIDEDLVGGYCSNNTGRLRVKNEWANKLIPEYNEILFQSIFIQSQIEQKKAQTGQPKINDNEIKTVKIPVLPKPVQQKIADLVYQSHKSHREANELLDQAKHKVEQLIESKMVKV